MNKNNPITYANPAVQIQSIHRQAGALLPLTLVILLVVTLLAISAVSSTNVSLQIAGNQQRQFEAVMVAENAVNFLVDNYPSRTMPTGANFETLGFSMGQGTPAEACVTKTIVAGSGTPGSLACAWTGSAGIGNNVTRDHESFSGKKSCRVGDYVEEEHPHLHHMSGSPKELWINGDITIKHCGGCFDDAEATIYYTGSNINSCSITGTWPSEVTATNVSLAQFNTATGAGPLVGGDYYSHMEIRVTATDPNSGATATAVRGIKYRGDNTTSTTVGSPTNSNCGITNATAMASVAVDSDLTESGSKKVMYAYLEIE